MILLHILGTAIVTVALWHLVAWALVRSTPVPHAPVIAPHAIQDAVIRACVDLGLPAEAVGLEFDLVRTGKVYEVLHRAALAVQKDHELRTVQDVCAWLAVAPERTAR